MPSETIVYPRPTRILSKSNLETAWRKSRDSSKKSGAPGVDDVRASVYAAKLDGRLSTLAKRIRTGNFGFSRLRPNPIPKPGTSKDRVICIPTVEDRLVQRVIANYLHTRKIFPIYNAVSYGFIPEIGTKKALSEVLSLRKEYDFVFETDISAFFDNIDRNLLIAKVEKTLGKHSLVPLLRHVITTEIKETNQCNRAKLESLGIFSGKGLRQGMPLSPTLANLALAEFDSAVQAKKIKMIRYADDIVVFATSKRAAHEAGNFIADKLGQFGHSIPKLGENSKTRMASKRETFEFLGREIVFSAKAGDFVQRVPNSKIEKMRTAILELAELKIILETELSFPEVAGKITQKAASYIASYSDAENATHLKNEMKKARIDALKRIYSEIFGESAIKNLNATYLQFLGLKTPSMELGDFEYTS